MQILNNSLLNILIPNENRALQDVLKQADTQTLEQMLNSKTITISDVLKNLFDDLKAGNKTNSSLEEILKNTNILKELGNFSSNLSTLLKNLEGDNPLFEKFKSLLENIFKDIKDIDSSNLKENISKTGVFLESKIANILKDENLNPQLLKNTNNSDMKSILLQLSEELSAKGDGKSQEILKSVEKLLTTIDFYQLNSLVSNSNSVYVPFFWEMLDEGTINLKAAEEDRFFCQINLSLKDFGKVDLMLALYDKNKLDLTIQAQREHFKTAIRENLQSLKQSLNSVDLIPVNIRLLDMKEDNDKPKENIYSNQENISFGLDIRA